jgi:hypothetical protein
MGFGAGAFFMGRSAPGMIAAFKVVDEAGVVTASGVAKTWYIWGVIFLILVPEPRSFLKILRRDGSRGIHSCEIDRFRGPTPLCSEKR